MTRIGLIKITGFKANNLVDNGSKVFSMFSSLRDLNLSVPRLVTSRERPGQARQIKKVA